MTRRAGSSIVLFFSVGKCCRGYLHHIAIVYVCIIRISLVSDRFMVWCGLKKQSGGVQRFAFLMAFI